MAMGKKGSLDRRTEWSVVQKDETTPRLDRDPVSVKITPPLALAGDRTVACRTAGTSELSVSVCVHWLLQCGFAFVRKQGNERRPKRGLGGTVEKYGKEGRKGSNERSGGASVFLPLSTLPSSSGLFVTTSLPPSLPLSPFTITFTDIFDRRRRILGHLFTRESDGEIGFRDFPLLIEMARSFAMFRNPH